MCNDTPVFLALGSRHGYMLRMRQILLAALVATAVLPGAGIAGATPTGGPIVSFINAQRKDNHIPAGIKESAKWSAACTAHNHYEALNGGLTHVEQTVKPGYTKDGAEAAAKGVLYQGVSWTSTQDPFESAPLHLAQVLAPRIDSVGAAESEGAGCVTTLTSRNRSAPANNITYTYPMDGATGWRTSEVAAEGPYTPGQRRGLPQGAKTGPYLLAMFDGPQLGIYSQAKVSSASLKGPGGAVKIVTADNRTSGLNGYLPTGAYLIPRKPLQPHTKYTAKVAAKIVGTNVKFVHSWSFTTA